MPTIKKDSSTTSLQEYNSILDNVQEQIANEIPTTTSFNDDTTKDSVNSAGSTSNSPQQKSQLNGGSSQS